MTVPLHSQCYDQIAAQTYKTDSMGQACISCHIYFTFKMAVLTNNRGKLGCVSCSITHTASAVTLLSSSITADYNVIRFLFFISILQCLLLHYIRGLNEVMSIVWPWCLFQRVFLLAASSYVPWVWALLSYGPMSGPAVYTIHIELCHNEKSFCI